MKVLANAKINLTLNVLNKRDDGYHDLKSIVYPIALADEIKLSESDVDIVTYNIPIEDDLVIKAVKLLKSKFQITKSVRIDIVKNIPIGAGLGGGSADVGAVLRALNDLWEINLSLKELADIGLEIGSDVPFCVYNKPAMVKGRGEILSQLPKLDSYVLLVLPDTRISTKRAFEALKSVELTEKDITNQLITIGKKQLGELASTLFNDFHNVVIEFNEECYVASRHLQQINPNFTLTGTGSVFFALYDSIENLRNDEKKIVELDYNTIHSTLN